jgi:hypothetical protein
MKPTQFICHLNNSNLSTMGWFFFSAVLLRYSAWCGSDSMLNPEPAGLAYGAWETSGI